MIKYLRKYKKQIDCIFGSGNATDAHNKKVHQIVNNKQFLPAFAVAWFDMGSLLLFVLLSSSSLSELVSLPPSIVTSTLSVVV